MLYRWPDAAYVGTRVAKDKFTTAGTAKGAARERFATEVARITWGYKLAEATVNLPGSDEVPEIQVFAIHAKADDVSVHVLGAIDRAIPYPIIFEVHQAETPKVRMTGAHKQLTSGRPKLSAYYSTGWMAETHPRQALPTAITLDALYVALLQPLVPTRLHVGNSAQANAERLGAHDKLEREVAALTRKIRNEPQLNRQVELRRTLTCRQAELDAQREP